MRSTGYLLIEGIKGLWKNRTMTFASIIVLVSGLLITGIAALLSINVDFIMNEIQGSNSITVYLETTTPKITAIQIGEEIRSMDNVSNCTYIPGDEALEQMILSMGEDGSVLEGLGTGFMPDAYNISLKDLDMYQESINQISAMEYVDSYTDYAELADRLNELSTLINYGSIALISILSVVSLFIISNTIKVTMFSRRIEISIMKSVGATNGFVRLPFIVEGILIGLLAGAISFTVIFFAYDQVTEAIYNLVPFITVVNIDPYMYYLLIGCMAVGAIFGMMGGVISIGRYLKREGENKII